MEIGLKEGEIEGEKLPLKRYIVGSLPTILYIPNFITQSEQAQLLHHIYEMSASRWKSLKNRRLQNWGGMVHEKGLLPQELPPWLKNLTQRISEHTGLFPSAINHVLINEYLPDQGIMPHQDGPAYFPVVAILSLESPIVIDFTPHTRLKECTSGHIEEDRVNDGLTASQVLENGSSNEPHPPCSVLLMPCSLLIFKDQAYSDYLHGIQDSEVHRLDKVVNISELPKLPEKQLERGIENTAEVDGQNNSSFRRSSTRVSLTCRVVLRVHRKLFKF